MPTKQSTHTGYLLIDHRDSPGVSEDFAQASGKDVIAVPGGTTLEADTYTCPHCNALVVKNPDRTRERAVCRKCMQVVCDSCVGECVPFAKVLDELHAVAHRLDTRGLTLNDMGLLVPEHIAREKRFL